MERNQIDLSKIYMDVYIMVKETFCTINLLQPIVDYQISRQIKNVKTAKDVLNFKTIVILDRSGSMGNNVKRMVNEILPQMFTNLGYSNEDVITLITFDSIAEVIELPIKKMLDYKINCKDSTYMAYAIEKLSNILIKRENKYIRLLAISDGELHDQEATLSASSDLANRIKNDLNDLIIDSQAIRFFTSQNQPSKIGLSSILLLNTLNEATLIDIKSTSKLDEIVAKMTALFRVNNFKVPKVGEIKIQAEDNILKISPWSIPLNSMTICAGKTSLWLAPMKDIYGNFGFSYLDSLKLYVIIGSEKIKINILKKEINNQEYEELLKPKVDHYYNRIYYSKKVNHASSCEEINMILGYFKNFDTKSTYNKLAELANNEEVNKMNSAQHTRNTNDNNILENADLLDKNISSVIKVEDSFSLLSKKITKIDEIENGVELLLKGESKEGFTQHFNNNYTISDSRYKSLYEQQLKINEYLFEDYSRKVELQKSLCENHLCEITKKYNDEVFNSRSRIQFLEDKLRIDKENTKISPNIELKFFKLIGVLFIVFILMYALIKYFN